MKKTMKSAVGAGLAIALAVSPASAVICDFVNIPVEKHYVKAASETSVKTYDELVKAVKKSGTIRITDNIKVTEPVTIPSGVSVVITSSKEDICIYPSAEMSKLFVVNGSLQLGASAADKVVKLRGGSAEERRITTCIVHVDGGKFTNYSGKLYKSKSRALRLTDGATAVLHDGSDISDNTGKSSSNENGGAVTVGSSSTLHIKGGSISKNDYGAIYCGSGSTINMSSGVIASNSIGAGSPGDDAGDGYGGGVYCNGTFEMSGGEIKNNSAQKKGGGVYITDSGKFYIKKSASITGNDVALAANAKLYVSDKLTGSSTVQITPDSYAVGKVVASSSISAMNASEFANKIVLSNSSWKLKPSGKNLEITKEYTVSYNANGGDSAGLPEKITVYANDAHKITDVTPSRTGFTFKGWNTKADGTGGPNISAGANVSVTDNLTFYAQWEENDVTVTYDANGGEGAPEKQVGKYTQGVAISSVIPTRKGYTFTGWNTKADGTGITYVTTMSTQADLTLYAQWKENVISVTYDANGGSDAPEKQTGTELKGIKISSKIPVRSGYIFRGWNTAADGSGVTYSANAIVNADIVLYAQWEKLKNVTAEVVCSDSNVKLNNNDTNTYGIKCKKKLTFKVKAKLDGKEQTSGVTVFYQIVKKGYDYDISNSAWTPAQNGKFTISKAMKDVRVYIKISVAGQIIVTKTHGFTLDATAPSVSGVVNGKTYKSARTIKVSDSVSGVKSITLDGKKFKSGKKVSKKGSHKLVVTDKFGNKKTIKFKIK